MNSKIYLLLISIFVLGLLSYKVTYSFFSNQVTSTGNVFAAASNFPTPTPSFHVVINEVFHNGGNTGSDWKDQWLELYNQTGSPVDVSGWTFSNASGSNVLPTSSPIPANGYAVITGNLSSTSIPIGAVHITVDSNKLGSLGFVSAGDLAKLLNGATLIDQMSYGTDTTVFASPPAAPSSTTSVARSPNGADTDNSTDWNTNVTTSIGDANP